MLFVMIRILVLFAPLLLLFSCGDSGTSEEAGIIQVEAEDSVMNEAIEEAAEQLGRTSWPSGRPRMRTSGD